ncbi:MAG: YcnI family protein [Jatrophihabitans sp.]
MSALFALASPATAHVTVSSPGATQGGYAVVTFLVPNEQAAANTTKVEVQFPTDTTFASASVQPIAGWTAVPAKTALAKPITTDDGVITEGVSTITWTASADAAIKPGQFQQFNVSVGPLPEKASITFKAIQTYSNGDVVRWIETPAPGSTEEPEHPAPMLTLAAATGDAHAHGGDSAASPSVSARPEVSASGGDSSNTVPVGVSIIALVLAVGALGLGVVNRAKRST